MSGNQKKLKFETLCVHGAGAGDTLHGALIPPIYQTSTFRFDNVSQGANRFAGVEKGYIYSRLGNPTVNALEDQVALLEGGEGALAFASGMAATTSTILALVPSGKNIVTSDTLYGGTYNMFQRTLPHLGIEVREAHINNYEQYESLIDHNTNLIFIETPANPTLGIIDIRKVAEIGRRHQIPVMVDNTFASPYFQRPIEFGADIVMHSATKFIGGHGDVIAGIIVSNCEIIGKMRKIAVSDIGGTMSPFNAWLLLRGLKTLTVRMERHQENGLTIARYLEQHPKVERVWYPLLESHPDYELARQQMHGFSGMMSFELKGGLEAGKIVMNNVKLHTLAVSLGDCDSLIQHPVTMTHAGYSSDDLKRSGITEGLIRLSAGIEHSDDLIADLDQALAKII